MKKILLFIIPILFIACQVTKQATNDSSNTGDGTTPIVITTNTIQIADSIDYEDAENSSYYVVMPVRVVDGKYYFVDQNFDAIQEYDLQTLDLSKNLPLENVKYSFIPKRGELLVDYPSTIEYFIVFTLVQNWTMSSPKAFEMTKPEESMFEAGSPLHYMQKINFTSFILQGKYDLDGRNPIINSHLISTSVN
ncbi:MAG: hypothetical protein ACRCS8_02880 [Brevinema sp.]